MAGAGLARPDVVWRDALHEGPVYGSDVVALAALRARFIADSGWAAHDEVCTQFEARDRLFSRALRDADEIVLWFEHDLYDQLQRLQVIERAAQATSRCCTISEAQVEGYLSEADPAALQAGFARRLPVQPATLAQCARAWHAFTGADPAALEAFLDEDLDGSPHLGAAIRRWREEFPGLQDGVSRTERQVLDALARGVFRTRDLFASACQHAESARFVGDTVFASILCRMAGGARPLLSHPDQRAVTMPDSAVASRVFWNDALLITRNGRDVLGGSANWMVWAPARWLGGVLLHGREGWRWDPASNRLQRVLAG